MRISDWSSDVCSSDLGLDRVRVERARIGECDARLVIETAAEADLADLVIERQHIIEVQRILRLGHRVEAVVRAETDDRHRGGIAGIRDRIGRRAVERRVGIGKGAAKGQSLDRDQADLRLDRSEEHTSELPSLMRISYAVFCLKKKQKKDNDIPNIQKLQ